MKMSRKPFRFDHKIKSLEDRIEFVNKYIEEISKSEFLVDMASTYILRASDIESERKIEYSYYRDNSEFNNVGRGKKTKLDDTAQDLLKEEIKKDRFVSNEDKAEILSSVEMFEYQVSDGYVNSMFCYNDIEIQDIKRCIKEGCPKAHDISNENIRSNILGVYDFMIGGCKSDEDRRLMYLYSQGISDVDVALDMNVSKQAIGRRFKRIFKNAQKRLTQ